MENYEVISVAGEGSYGIVMKCRHRLSKKIVAIKKIIDYNNNDNYVKKMILREVRILKRLRHDNLIQLFEVFKKRRRFYLVFEFLEKTVLNDLDSNPKGLGEQQTLEYVYQLIRAVVFCHNRNIIHRDIKPENLLVSSTGVLKLCDFGCARILSSCQDCIYTEYVATRWYRAPELLVRDTQYGKPVDIWAVGCVLVEMLSGEPLFPGQSDVDQLYMIMKCFGKLCPRHQQILGSCSSDFQCSNNKVEGNYAKYSKSSMNNFHALHTLFPTWSIDFINLVALCLNTDPEKRSTATQLLNNDYFKSKNIHEKWFTSLLKKSEEQILKSLSKSELGHDMELISDNFTQRNFNGIKVSSNDNKEKRSFDGNNSNLRMKSPDKNCNLLSSLTRTSSSNITSASMWNKKEYICLPVYDKVPNFSPQSPLANLQPRSPMNIRNVNHNESKKCKNEVTEHKSQYVKKQITQNKSEFSSLGDLSLPYLKSIGNSYR